ncbi:MAG: hypothetical protein AAFY24_02020 [Pseudomonadota bacterium]
MNDPITLHLETKPTWFRTICPVETVFEKQRRIEKEFRDLDDARARTEAAYEARKEEHDNRELFLMEQRRELLVELEAAGEDV